MENKNWRRLGSWPLSPAKSLTQQMVVIKAIAKTRDDQLYDEVPYKGERSLDTSILPTTTRCPRSVPTPLQAAHVYPSDPKSMLGNHFLTPPASSILEVGPSVERILLLPSGTRSNL